MTEIKRVRYCAHCGHKSPQKVVYHETYVSECYHEEDGSEFPLVYGRIFLTRCQTCFHFSLYDWDETMSNPEMGLLEFFWDATLAWPNSVKLDVVAVPSSILEIYEEASKVKSLSPSSSECVRGNETKCLLR